MKSDENYLEGQSYIDNNNSISSLDLEDNKKLLMVTYGNRNNLIINSLDNIDEMDENSIKNKDNGEFGFNIYQL